MLPARRRRAGQPVLALALIVTLWGGARLVFWQGGDDVAGRPVAGPVAGPVVAVAQQAERLPDSGPLRRGLTASAASALQLRSGGLPVAAVAPVAIVPPLERVGTGTGAEAAGAGFPAMPVRLRRPGFTLSLALGAQESEAAEPAAKASQRMPMKDDPRWSGDNWLLLRPGSGAAAQAPGAASYGASQAGAVVRYRLGRGEPRDSYAYLRTSLAINAPGRDREIALGLGVRPVSRVPLRVLAEARLQDTRASPAQLRPVATVITELPPLPLPLGLMAEVYGQAGYAGGRGATPFYDVQAMVDHPLAGLAPPAADLRIGAGLWSGGQRGAVRFDVGPRASFRIDPGGTNAARVAIDWRFRLAGNARPGSGPALTIASSF